MYKNNFAQNFKKQRERFGLTQKAIAEKLNISEQSISKWERGQGYPDFEKLGQISEILKISLDDLIKDKKEIKYMSKLKDIVVNGDLAYLKDHQHLLFVVDELGNCILDYAFEYEDYGLVKEIIQMIKDDTQLLPYIKKDKLVMMLNDYYHHISSLLNSSIQNVNYKGYYFKLFSLAIKNNDLDLIKQLHLQSGYKNIRDIRNSIAKSPMMIKTFVNHSLNKEVWSYCLKNLVSVSTLLAYDKYSMWEMYEAKANPAFMSYLDSLAVKKLVIESYRKDHEKRHQLANAVPETIHLSNHLKIKLLDTLNLKSNHSHYDYLYEEAYLLANKELVQYLEAKGMKEKFCMLGLKYRDLSTIKRYDNHKDWDYDRKKTYLDKSSKFVQALYTYNKDIIIYMLKHSKTELKPLEALVFGDFEIFKSVFNHHQPLAALRLLRTRNMTQLKNVLIENKGILNIQDELTDKFELYFNEDSKRSLDIIEALLSKGTERFYKLFDSKLVSKDNIAYQYGSYPSIGKWGIKLAIRKRDIDLIKFLLPLIPKDYLQEILEDIDSIKLESIIKDYMIEHHLLS